MFEHSKLQLLGLVVVCVALCIGTQKADASNAPNGLKSGYLDSSVWNKRLSSKEINDQVKGHFAEVLARLEAKKASGLLTALIRAEASSGENWSRSERRAVLIFLAAKRQQQMNRIRDYMNRGRFPLNEGHCPDVTPVFVDRHGTHCAVAHLMRSDGLDTEVARIVKADNLVRVSNVKDGGMFDWIRTSGLTQEEVAMAQPTYPDNPVEGIRTFWDISDFGGMSGNGLVISDVSIRGARFTATLPTSFQNTPGAIDALFDLSVAELDGDNAINLSNTVFGATKGLVLGGEGTSGNNVRSTPNNLSNWLYIGPYDFGKGLIGGANVSGNVGVFEVDYKIRAQEGRDFSRVGLFASENYRNEINDRNERNAALLLSQIYHGDSNALLSEQRLFVAGSESGPTRIGGSEISSLSADFLRIRSYAMVAGSGYIDTIFNEFETIPEPSSGVAVLLIGAFFLQRRNRRLC